MIQSIEQLQQSQELRRELDDSFSFCARLFVETGMETSQISRLKNGRIVRVEVRELTEDEFAKEAGMIE